LAKAEMPGVNNSLPGNSYEERDNIAEQKSQTNTKQIVKAKQVANGKIRKESLVKKFGRYILEDTIETAKEHTIKEILLPGIRNLIFDSFNEMVATMLFGDDAPRPSTGYRSGSRKVGRTSYDKYYDDKQRRNESRNVSYRDMPRDPDEIIVDTRAQANYVLDEVDSIIRQYGQASIAQFYDAAGVTGEWTDNRYGWESIRGAQVKQVRDGWVILMPPTIVLDR
jgi:hypothetical protein